MKARSNDSDTTCHCTDCGCDHLGATLEFDHDILGPITEEVNTTLRVLLKAVTQVREAERTDSEGSVGEASTVEMLALERTITEAISSLSPPYATLVDQVQGTSWSSKTS